MLVGFVGRLTEIKNLSLFLKAAREYERLDDATLPTLHFVIAGDGHLGPALKAEVARA